MVDLWGDIPYSEYNVQGNNAPKPDSSKDIYNSLIALLEEANANFKNPEAISGLIPGKDDFFYGEEKTTAAKIDKWIRLNNTIQLRLLLQSRKAKADITGWKTKLDALMVEDKFMTSGGDLQFWYNRLLLLKICVILLYLNTQGSKLIISVHFSTKQWQV